MRAFWADLHLHTVLSPCAEVEMIPPLIVRQALALGLDWIAVTDHNAVANAGAVQEAAAGTGLAVTPGLEVESREEVHMLCLFDALPQAEAWAATVAAHLPRRANDEQHFGAQYVVDARGDYVRTEERLLLASTDLSVEEICAGVSALGGLTVPAHVDRPVNSLLANLGFMPPGLPVPAIEISRWQPAAGFRQAHPELASFGLIGSGDAHRPTELLRRTVVVAEAPTLAELRRAWACEKGRSVLVRDP
jgi:3',5'-nucleoside bisphosphate phosphatase